MKLILIIMTTALLWGCGKANDSAVTVDSAGKHPSGWVASHSDRFLNSSSSCKDCHGATLTGGISGVSCSSASFNGLSCHATGPHPIPWPAHNQSTNQLNNCSPCHGVALTGGATAPACSSCHTQLLPGTVPVTGTCTSCHGAPPNGAAFPNLSAAHKAHTQLALSCAVCHAGGGSGTPNHGKSLTVAINAGYNANSGAAVMNADGSCSNVSCHGGKTTQFWRGGTIDPLQDCLLCHDPGPSARTPQNNSYYSGEHQKHLNLGLLCIDCHDMKDVPGGASHFSGLLTPAFELSPANTMRVPLNFNSGVRSCSPGSTPANNSFSIGVCHSTKNW